MVGCLPVVAAWRSAAGRTPAPQQGREQGGVRGRGLHGEDNLSPCVSLLEMADGLGGLGQRVSPVDHRCDLPGFGEFGGRAGARPLPPTGGGTACRAASPRPRISSSSSWLRASADPSSCMSSITSQSRSSSRTRSVSSRSEIAHPSRSGAAVTPAPVPTPGPSGAARPAATSRTAAVPLLPAHRHPRGPFRQAGLAGPRPQQDRLPAPRRGRRHRHPRRRLKPLEQPGAGHDSSRPRAGDRPATASDARAGPMARSSHKASWHPQPACGPVDLRCHRQEVLELVGFEHTAQRLGGLGPAPPAAGRMACERSALNRRSKIWQRVTSVLLMLPLLSGLRRWPRLSRSGSPARRPAVTAAWQERPARVTGRGASVRARRGRVLERVPTSRAGRG